MGPWVLSVVVLDFAVKHMGYKFTILCKTEFSVVVVVVT